VLTFKVDCFLRAWESATESDNKRDGLVSFPSKAFTIIEESRRLFKLSFDLVIAGPSPL
jgi:hypothetical protein